MSEGINRVNQLIESCRARDSRYLEFIIGQNACTSVDREYMPLTPEELYEHDELRKDDKLFWLGAGESQGEAEWLEIHKNNELARAIREGVN